MHHTKDYHTGLSYDNPNRMKKISLSAKVWVCQSEKIVQIGIFLIVCQQLLSNQLNIRHRYRRLTEGTKSSVVS